jgi:hypothetical protein
MAISVVFQIMLLVPARIHIKGWQDGSGIYLSSSRAMLAMIHQDGKRCEGGCTVTRQWHQLM